MQRPLAPTRRLSENREPTAEKPFWPDFTIKFVKYAQYSPHLIEKSGSKWLSLATAPILGQPPRTSGELSFSYLKLMLLNNECRGFRVIDKIPLIF